MPDPQDPKQVSSNDLRNAQFGGGFVNADTVNAGRIGGDIVNNYNYYNEQPNQKIEINWHQVSSSLLNEHLRLTTNPLTMGEGITYRTEQVYVPLGLVERKKQSRRREDVSPEKGSELYRETEITQTFQHQQFIEQVLKNRQSPRSQGRRIAIIGEPGAGKTTLLQQIAQWVSKEIEQSVVIWVSLADLRSRELESYLLEVWLQVVARKVGQAEASSPVKDDFVTQFNQGLVWLVLDGVDEMQVTDGNPLREIERQIRQGGLLQQARIVLSCRLNLWDAGSNALDFFDNYRTLDFSYPQQVEQFINNWFGSLPSAEIQTGQRLCAALRESGKARIRDLVKNPLRLTLLCFNWYLGEGKLPETKAGLYEQFVADFYEWKKGLLATTEEQRKRLNAALGELAREAIDKEATRFRLRQEFVCKYLGEPDDADSLFGLALRLGWLNKVEMDAENSRKAVYAFYHPTFEEYFAALAIDDWDFFLPREHKNRPVKDKHLYITKPYRIFEPQWKEVILLWLGRKDVEEDEKETFIKELVKFNDGCRKIYFYHAYYLATEGIAEFPKCSLFREITESTVKLVVDTSNVKKQLFEPIRKGAEITLAQQELVTPITNLVKIIRNSKLYESTQWSAVESLGQIGFGNQTAIDTLVELIEDENIDSETKYKAAESLGKIGTTNQTLIHYLENLTHAQNVDDDTKCFMAMTLGLLVPGNPNAIDALVELIRDESIYIATSYTVTCLGQIGSGNQTAIDALVDLISNPNVDDDTKDLVVNNLEKIGSDNQIAIDALAKLIRNQNVDNDKYYLVESLGKIGAGNQTAINALVYLIYEQNIDNDTKYYVVENLGKIATGNQSAVNALSELINSQNVDNQTKCQAVVSLGKIDLSSQLAVNRLVELINDPNVGNFIKSEALVTLATTDSGKKIAVNTLVELLHNSNLDNTIKYEAAITLVKIDLGNQCAIDILIEFICNKNEYVAHKIFALNILVHALKKEQMANIVTALKDSLLVLDENAALLDILNTIYRENLYSFFWHCTQNMSYPDFYNAWYQDKDKNEIIRVREVSQNQLNLHQHLQAEINNDSQLSQNIHLICINASKFIDPDNPASRIYTSIVKTGCPKCPDGTPKTILELQTYWDLLETDKQVVLLFYSGTTNTTGGVAFSNTFLNAISRFEGKICFISDPIPSYNTLQVFTPNQSVDEILEWLRCS